MFKENSKEKNCRWKWVVTQEAPFADLLCIFRISPDLYFLPALAACFWCFLLVYKLNVIESYPNEHVCLEQNKFENKSGPAFVNPIQQIE